MKSSDSANLATHLINVSVYADKLTIRIGDKLLVSLFDFFSKKDSWGFGASQSFVPDFVISIFFYFVGSFVSNQGFEFEVVKEDERLLYYHLKLTKGEKVYITKILKPKIVDKRSEYLFNGQTTFLGLGSIEDGFIVYYKRFRFAFPIKYRYGAFGARKLTLQQRLKNWLRLRSLSNNKKLSANLFDFAKKSKSEILNVRFWGRPSYIFTLEEIISTTEQRTPLAYSYGGLIGGPVYIAKLQELLSEAPVFSKNSDSSCNFVITHADLINLARFMRSQKSKRLIKSISSPSNSEDYAALLKCDSSIDLSFQRSEGEDIDFDLIKEPSGYAIYPTYEGARSTRTWITDWRPIESSESGKTFKAGGESASLVICKDGAIALVDSNEIILVVSQKALDNLDYLLLKWRLEEESSS